MFSFYNNNCEKKKRPQRVPPSDPEYDVHAGEYYYLSEWEYENGSRTSVYFDDTGMKSFEERQKKLFPECYQSQADMSWLVIAVLGSIIFYHLFIRKTK